MGVARAAESSLQDPTMPAQAAGRFTWRLLEGLQRVSGLDVIPDVEVLLVLRLRNVAAIVVYELDLQSPSTPASGASSAGALAGRWQACSRAAPPHMDSK